MSNVSIEIAGRKFTVACAQGEEAHIAQLGRIIDAKISAMPGLASQSETRCLLYAALLLADENFELGTKAAGRQDLAGPAATDIAEPLEAAAERLEAIASRLENAAA